MRSSERLTQILCGVVAVLVATPCLLQAGPPSSLLKKLTSESYPERVQAEEALRTWAENGGEPAENWLFEQQQSAGNPEARRRCRRALKALVMSELTRQRPGFVGVGMRSLKVVDAEDAEVFGVEVIELTRGGPAEKAGLQETDIILELNGKSWTRSRADDEFAERIAALRGGDVVQMKVLRGRDHLNVDLVLTYRPWSAGLYREQTQRRAAPFAGRSQIPASEAAAEDEVFRDWMEKQKSKKPVR